jgi:hypothetical protein
LITSLYTTESHIAIQSQIAQKRDRSLARERGFTNFRHLVESISIVDHYSQGGVYLGKAPAFNLNQDVMNRFFDRVTRALLYFENSIIHADCNIEWRISPTFDNYDQIPSEFREFLSYGKIQTIGDDVFTYVGWYLPGHVRSLWLMNFYGGIEFMTIVRELE